MNGFRVGEWIMLIAQKGKKWLVRIEDAPFSTHLGTVQMGEVLEKEEGDSLVTNKGARLFIFRPTLEDYIFCMPRQTQIIYPKDLGAIVFYGDIQPGMHVLESGVGSGALSLALLRALGECGMLISVEKRPEFARLALTNVSKFLGRKPENFHITVGDIESFSLNRKVDRAFLDLPEPWHAVASVGAILRRGGLLLSLSPNVGQVQLMYRELRANGFANVRTFELLKRDWMVDERRARPVDRMVSHTGFITIAKKIPALPVDVVPLCEEPLSL